MNGFLLKWIVFFLGKETNPSPGISLELNCGQPLAAWYKKIHVLSPWTLSSVKWCSWHKYTWRRVLLRRHPSEG